MSTTVHPNQQRTITHTTTLTKQPYKQNAETVTCKLIDQYYQGLGHLVIPNNASHELWRVPRSDIRLSPVSLSYSYEALDPSCHANRKDK